MIGFILWIVVGGVAGYIAARLLAHKSSMLTNIGLGIAGSFVANVVLWFLGFSGNGNLLGQLVMGIIGAVILIIGYRAYQKRT